MTDHRVEAARLLQAFRCFDIRQIQSDINPRLGRGLNQAELLFAPEADIRLFWRQLYVFAKSLNRFDKRVLDWQEIDLAAGVLRCNEIATGWRT